MVEFFGTKIARQLADEGRSADLVLGNNVFAQVPDLNDFVEGLKIILKPDGVLTLEFPHLLQLMERNEFDTIYHEHFSYFSLLTTIKIMEAHGLRVFDVEELKSHGGSLRVFACRAESKRHKIEPNVAKVLADESRAGLDRDYPDRAKKPVDAPFPPFADAFPLEQHRLGPFGPILDAQKAKR